MRSRIEEALDDHSEMSGPERIKVIRRFCNSRSFVVFVLGLASIAIVFDTWLGRVVAAGMLYWLLGRIYQFGKNAEKKYLRLT